MYRHIEHVCACMNVCKHTCCYQSLSFLAFLVFVLLVVWSSSIRGMLDMLSVLSHSNTHTYAHNTIIIIIINNTKCRTNTNTTKHNPIKSIPKHMSKYTVRTAAATLWHAHTRLHTVPCSHSWVAHRSDLQR